MSALRARVSPSRVTAVVRAHPLVCLLAIGCRPPGDHRPPPAIPTRAAPVLEAADAGESRPATPAPAPLLPVIGTWTRTVRSGGATTISTLTFHPEGTVTDTFEQHGQCRGRFTWRRVWSPTTNALSASVSCSGGAVCEDGGFGVTIGRWTCRTERRDRWTYDVSADGATLTVRSANWRRGSAYTRSSPAAVDGGST